MKRLLQQRRMRNEAAMMNGTLIKAPAGRVSQSAVPATEYFPVVMIVSDMNMMHIDIFSYMLITPGSGRENIILLCCILFYSFHAAISSS